MVLRIFQTELKFKDSGLFQKDYMVENGEGGKGWVGRGVEHVTALLSLKDFGFHIAKLGSY